MLAIKAWRALAGGYSVETVEDCVIETQTGFQRRRPEQQIDQAALVNSLKAVNKVGDKEGAAAIVREPLLFSSLDVGEQSLWAHALTRTDAWVLCGPDRASLRFGIRLGCRERLVALETLLTDAGPPHGFEPTTRRTGTRRRSVNSPRWRDRSAHDGSCQTRRCAGIHY